MTTSPGDHITTLRRFLFRQCPRRIGPRGVSCRRSKGSNSYFTRRAPRTPPRATEFHFSFILLLDTAAAEEVGLIVRTVELDQTAILGITPPTMRTRFIIHRFGHDPPSYMLTYLQTPLTLSEYLCGIVSWYPLSHAHYFHRAVRACRHCCRDAPYKEAFDGSAEAGRTSEDAIGPELFSMLDKHLLRIASHDCR